jgi:beta-galactosidase
MLILHNAGYIRAEDPSRPVHYEGGGFTTPATDIICPMYARVAQIQAFAAMAPESERRPGVKMLTYEGTKYCSMRPRSTAGQVLSDPQSISCVPSGILCEYAHSMGNSTGNFKEYWDCFERLPQTQVGPLCPSSSPLV